MKENKNLWGIPYSTEISTEALVKDFWDPNTEEMFPPKNFLGLGWGVNLYAIGKKAGLLG